MSNRGFVAWANARAQEDRYRESQLGTDLVARVRRGELSLSEAEKIQRRRGAPKI